MLQFAKSYHSFIWQLWFAHVVEQVYRSLMPPPSREGVRLMCTTRTLRPCPGPVG